MKDMKETMGTGLKPDMSFLDTSSCTYICRTKEYGAHKYARGNHLNPVPDDKARFRAYIAAAIRHLLEVNVAMEQDDFFAIDPDSGLPHIAHAITGLSMTIEQAVKYRLIPEDPGQPWRKYKYE